MGKKFKSFKEWYDEDEEEFNIKRSLNENKRKQRRLNTALKRGDVEAYMEQDDWDDF